MICPSKSAYKIVIAKPYSDNPQIRNGINDNPIKFCDKK